MAAITLNNGHVVSDYGVPYFIAEVNSSHNGNLERAKEMISAAKQAGADCVKFQSWTADTLYSKSYYDANPIAKRMVTRFSMSPEDLRECAAYCAELGVGFSSTPYSKAEVDFLAELNVPFIKVASMDLNNYPYLEYIAKKQMPIILSTGMADMEEIEKAVQTIATTGNDKLCLLHCVSIYPPDNSIINLNQISALREKFPRYPIGYSDHSLGVEVPSAAIALGAGVIEKHFTLDKSKMGWDNGMAMEPDEFAKLVECCKNVQTAMGSKERIVPEAELKQRANMRRSIIAASDLPKGKVLEFADMDAKRPGTGLPPEMMARLVGKRLTSDIEKDTLINAEDIED